MTDSPEDPEFMDSSDEWKREASAWDKFKEQVKERDKKFMKEYHDITKDALVAQRSEQDAHNVLVGGSNPSEGTTSVPMGHVSFSNILDRALLFEVLQTLKILRGSRNSEATLSKRDFPQLDSIITRVDALLKIEDKKGQKDESSHKHL